MISESARKANLLKRASIQAYVQSSPVIRHGNTRYRVGLRNLKGRWISRHVPTIQEAQKLVEAYQLANTDAQREEILQHGRDKRHLLSIIAALSYVKKKKARNSFIHKRERRGLIRFEAYARLPGLRWRHRTFKTEEEAKRWIDICATAIRKAFALKQSENDAKREEVDYGESVRKFQREAVENTPALYRKHRPDKPEVIVPEEPFETSEEICLD